MMKEIAKRLIRREKYSSESYIEYLRRIGMTIGEDVTIYAPTKVIIDEQYPWMIEIGNHVRICEGVKILTHDYSWSVIKTINGEILGASGKVQIGNNVFIGIDAIITRNTTIGENVIIGTGAVVTKNCESNSVYVGNPARKVMSLDEYYQKRQRFQLIEAKKLAIAYRDKMGKIPDQRVFHEYFMLFSDENEIYKTPEYVDKIGLCMNEQQSLEIMKSSKAKFKNFDAFIQYCFDDDKNDEERQQ